MWCLCCECGVFAVTTVSSVMSALHLGMSLVPAYTVVYLCPLRAAFTHCRRPPWRVKLDQAASWRTAQTTGTQTRRRKTPWRYTSCWADCCGSNFILMEPNELPDAKTSCPESEQQVTESTSKIHQTQCRVEINSRSIRSCSVSYGCGKCCCSMHQFESYHTRVSQSDMKK